MGDFMPIVPEFLIKKIYQKGSLKKRKGKLPLCSKMCLARDLSADLILLK